MKPPADLPLELVLIGEAFARRLGMPPSEFWAVVYRKAPAPPGWAAAWADAFAPLGEALTSQAENDTLDTMDASETVSARRGRPLSQRKHPFIVALIREGLTIAEVAEDLKRPASSVKSWYKAEKDDGWRPIPRTCAIKLRDRLGVPLSAWARISD